MEITPEQQELIDLLRNELAEVIDNRDSQGTVGEYAVQLQEYCAYAENIGNAASLVGLTGLTDTCKYLKRNFDDLIDIQTIISSDEEKHFGSWAEKLLAYLQYLGEKKGENDSIYALVNYLSSRHWPNPLKPDEAENLEREFFDSALIYESEKSTYPNHVTDKLVSMEFGEDVNPGLLQGLLTELPHQVDIFDKAIESYIETRDTHQLITAQRIAHTLKGSANIVGIAGMANLMHFTEDLLEQIEKLNSLEFIDDLLVDTSDCLASMSDFLIDSAPLPTNTAFVMQNILDTLNKYVGEQDGEENKGVIYSAEQDSKPDDDVKTIDKNKDESDHPDDEIQECDVEDEISLELEQEYSDLEFDDELNVDELEVAKEERVVTDDHEKREPLAHSQDEREQSKQQVELYSIAEQKEDIQQGHHTGDERSPSEKQDSSDSVKSTSPSSFSDDMVDYKFSLASVQAEELLRLSGEQQIGNTQLLGRVASLMEEVKSAIRYHDKLRQVSTLMERFAEHQSTLASAAAISASGEIDPIELERYNELHSFASELQEITTDAHESVAQMNEELQGLKNTVLEQRQFGFDSQNILLDVRMIPVSSLSSRFNRCVRQASRLTGKPAILTIVGEDVLVDSRVLNSLVDPIMHLLRNAVDHGLESSDKERIENGKPNVGRITLTFNREGESIIVICEDDGYGLDYAAIKESAIKKGLVNSDEEPSERELQKIILAPGFSTRAHATQTSGRGIGLDVVHDQIQQLKGSVTVESHTGSGTRFSISAPMSLLSAHTLIAKMGTHKLSLLSRGLDQIIFVEQELLREQDKVTYYIHEDAEVPVYKLEELLDLPEQIQHTHYSTLILFKNSMGDLRGVLVESISASEDQIIKPLPRYAYKTNGSVGAAILEDGSVSPVFDLLDLPELNIAADDFDKWKHEFKQKLTHIKNQTKIERPMALVVDDSLSARRSLAQFVSDMGMEVFTAKDGLEAIQVINQRKPSVILVDLEMPRMNGLELTSHIRANEETRDVPVIMITSRATEKHRSMATKVGANSYLNKPWTDEELLSSIQKQIAC